jgi:uncharacterized membrane protein YGL010W
MLWIIQFHSHSRYESRKDAINESLLTAVILTISHFYCKVQFTNTSSYFDSQNEFTMQTFDQRNFD